MRTRTFLIAGLLSFTFFGFASCSGANPELDPDTGETVTPEKPDNNNDNNNNDPMNNQVKITVGRASFSLILADNATAAAFKALLPLTLNMSEMNGNEKYYYLTDDLPTASSNPGTIQTGDLMLYGSSCLVLFYESFRTSYSYTRIGRVDNASGLAAALGSGSVNVTFKVNNNQ